MKSEVNCMIVVAHEEWQRLSKMVADIHLHLQGLMAAKPNDSDVRSPYITAKEFMSAVRICRSNFDKLVHQGKIMTLKKGRKIYVVASEVERYFKEM